MTPELRAHLLALGDKVMQAEAAERLAAEAVDTAMENHQRAMEDADAAVRAYDEAIETVPRRPGRPRKNVDPSAPQAAPPAPTPEPPPTPPIVAPEPATAAERAFTPGGDWTEVRPLPEHMVTAYLMVSTGREPNARKMLAGKVPDVDAAIAAIHRLGLLVGDTADNAWAAWCPADSPLRQTLPAALALLEVNGDSTAFADALLAMLAKGAA